MMASRSGIESEKVEIFYQENRGRGVRATTLIEPGTALYADEPYVFCLDDENRRIRCNHCLQKRDKLRSCGGCSFVYYCDRQCQASSYANHQYECKYLNTAESTVYMRTRLLLMMAHKYLKLQKGSKKVRKHNSQGFPLTPEGLCLTKAMMDPSMEEPSPDMTHFWEFVKKKNIPLPEDIVSYCLGILKANTFSIYDETKWKGIGEGLFTRLAMFNHDCRPNCVFIFSGREMLVRSIRTIQPGEECLICYVNLMKPTVLRQRTLKDWYGFDCSCQRCVLQTQKDRLMFTIKCPQMKCLGSVVPCDPGNMNDTNYVACDVCGFDIGGSDLPIKIAEMEMKIKSFWANKQQNDYIFLTECGPFLELLDSIYQPYSINVYKLVKKAFRVALRVHKDELALEYGIRCLLVLRTQLDSCDAFLGYNLWRVGQLEARLGGNLTTAHTTLSEALMNMRISYGSTHNVTRQAEELLAAVADSKQQLETSCETDILQAESNIIAELIAAE